MSNLLSNLPKVKGTTKKRMGRGLGSGKGKTGGRGMKGAKARGKIPAAAVGGGLILYKKLPYLRGWSRHGGNPARSLKPIIIKTSQLNVFKEKESVDLNSLIEKGLISEKEAKKRGVKILSEGELKVGLNINIAVSKSVKGIIEKAGGKVNSGI